MQETRGSHALRSVQEAQRALMRAWPQWRVKFDRLEDQSESFDLIRRVVRIDLRHWREGPAYAVRHALTHLDWGHVHGDEPFTDEQCDAADAVATLYTQE